MPALIRRHIFESRRTATPLPRGALLRLPPFRAADASLFLYAFQRAIAAPMP